jgi:hypothetical protein
MLCDPDPRVRGHIKNVKGNGNSYSMERFVAVLNLLATKAELKLRK